MLTWDEVVKALENDKYKWRTVRGVAKQLDASQQEIMSLMTQHLDEVIKSAVPAETGEDLFTTRRHYRRKASALDKITSSVTVSANSTSINED